MLLVDVRFGGEAGWCSYDIPEVPFRSNLLCMTPVLSIYVLLYQRFQEGHRK